MREVRPIEPGRVVRSKAGRDAGRYFVVMSLIDSEFVMMADGGLMLRHSGYAERFEWREKMAERRRQEKEKEEGGSK